MVTSDSQPALRRRSFRGVFTLVETFVGRGRRGEGEFPRGLSPNENAVFVEVGREIGKRLLVVFFFVGTAERHLVAGRHGEGGALQDHHAI